MEQDLTTVHHAMAEAAAETKAYDGPMTTFTFRAKNGDLVIAKEICERHGTNLSEYLRKCVEMLPRDFKP